MDFLIIKHILLPIPLHSVPLRSIPIYFTPFHSIPIYFTPLHSTPLYSISFHSIPFHSIPFHSIPFHSIPFHSIPFHSIPFHSIPFHSMRGSIPFHERTRRRLPLYAAGLDRTHALSCLPTPPPLPSAAGRARSPRAGGAARPAVGRARPRARAGAFAVDTSLHSIPLFPCLVPARAGAVTHFHSQTQTSPVQSSPVHHIPFHSIPFRRPRGVCGRVGRRDGARGAPPGRLAAAAARARGHVQRRPGRRAPPGREGARRGVRARPRGAGECNVT